LVVFSWIGSVLNTLNPAWRFTFLGLWLSWRRYSRFNNYCGEIIFMSSSHQKWEAPLFNFKSLVILSYFLVLMVR